MSHSLRILLSAYQCAPGTESVSQIGWHWYYHLAQRHFVTLITHSRNRPALTAAGAPLPQSEVIYVDTEWFAKPLDRLSWWLFPHSEHPRFLLTSLDFYVFDWKSIKLIKQRQRTGEQWDVTHTATPVSPRAATRMHTLGYPLILGPWNGNVGTPDQFPELVHRESTWLYPVRSMANLIHWLWGTFKHSQVILVANQATRDSIPVRYQARCQTMLENAVDLHLFQAQPYPAPPSKTQPLKLIFVGRLVYFKGLHMLLQAIAQVRQQHTLTLDVVGDGPLRTTWETLSHELGIEDLVTFHGALSANEVNTHINAAHALCLPSIRESGGAVLLEAMACARPVIAVAFGGPAEIVDAEVGCAIPPDGEAAVVQGLVAACFDLIAEPEAWQQRGLVGRQRAETCYGWHAKIDQAIATYQKVLESTQ